MAFPQVIVEFSPGTGPFDTPSWVDITDRVMGDLTWTVGRQRDLEDWPPGYATIELRNDDRLFDPENTAGTYYGQLLPRVPFRIRATYSAVTYDLFYGFVEDGWEQRYEPPATSSCVVTLVDLLAVLEGYTLPSVLETEILADSPQAYWPLDETFGQDMQDLSGNGFDGTYRSGTTALSTELSLSDNVKTPALDLDENHKGHAPDLELCLRDAPMVIEAIVLPKTTNLGGAVTVFYRSGTGNRGQGAVLHAWLPSGYIAGSRDSGMDAMYSSLSGDSNVDFSTPTHYAYRLTAGAASQHLYLNGEEITPVSTLGFGGNPAIPGVSVGGVDNAFADSGFDGAIAHVAQFDSDIGAARIEAHYQAAFFPLNNKRSDEQVEWILDQIGVPPGMYDLDTGVSIMGPLNSKDRNALELLREITATEQGALYVDHADGGKLKFRYRYFSWLETRATVSQATFTDDPAQTEPRIEPDSLRVESYGVRSIINRVTTQWSGGEVTAEDATSVGAYGPRSHTVTTTAKTPAQARGVSEWIVANNAAPRTRILGFAVDAGADDTAFPAALGVRIGDRVTFEHTPQNTGNQIDKALEVQGATHRVSDVQWLTDWYVTDAPKDHQELFILGSSLLGSTDILAY